MSRTRHALDMIFTDHFSRYEPGVFDPIRDALLTHGDHYMHLADLKSYSEADSSLGRFYAAPKSWTKQSHSQCGGLREISSDRTILEYARDTWELTLCPMS